MTGVRGRNPWSTFQPPSQSGRLRMPNIGAGPRSRVRGLPESPRGRARGALSARDEAAREEVLRPPSDGARRACTGPLPEARAHRMSLAPQGGDRRSPMARVQGGGEVAGAMAPATCQTGTRRGPARPRGALVTIRSPVRCATCAMPFRRPAWPPHQTHGAPSPATHDVTWADPVTGRSSAREPAQPLTRRPRPMHRGTGHPNRSGLDRTGRSSSDRA